MENIYIFLKGIKSKEIRCLWTDTGVNTHIPSTTYCSINLLYYMAFCKFQEVQKPPFFVSLCVAVTGFWLL